MWQTRYVHPSVGGGEHATGHAAVAADVATRSSYHEAVSRNFVANAGMYLTAAEIARSTAVLRIAASLSAGERTGGSAPRHAGAAI
jgi:hypothetical protein